jgi:hypothetical protein
MVKELCEFTGGSYKYVEKFGDLKYRIQVLANNSFSSVKCYIKLLNCIDEVQEQMFNTSTTFYMDISQKVKKLSHSSIKHQHPAEPAHKSNSEESEYRVINKDKWPIPLANTHFTMLN